ncbi:hypothetical protein SDC9_112668 [bioreactor metagenome]|uniref:Uncharacterized protein n=1 Tax=bioreactor metagenome TaxID=1076179 RepID=A0A645BKB8_9ZZZZ
MIAKPISQIGITDILLPGVFSILITSVTDAIGDFADTRFIITEIKLLINAPAKPPSRPIEPASSRNIVLISRT